MTAFLFKLINALKTGAANLKQTFTNYEGTSLYALQTRPQFWQMARSPASHVDQNVAAIYRVKSVSLLVQLRD